ncbi:MAG: hypothetical protein ACFFC6_10480 [Promethearchaeota archaeon]
MGNVSERIDYTKAFKLVEQYEEYRLRKSWGIMMLIVGISITYIRLIWIFYDWLAYFIDESFLIWYVFVPISYLLMFGTIIFPLTLAIITYFSTKRTIIEGNMISSKRYILYGIALFLLYFNSYWLPRILLPLIWVLFFPQSIVTEDNTIVFDVSSLIQTEANSMLWKGLSFLISYLLLSRIVKRIKFKELLVPGVILILLSGILIILGSSTAPPLTDTLERQISSVNTIIMAISFLGSGFYSIKKAYKSLEGRD